MFFASGRKFFYLTEVYNIWYIKTDEMSRLLNYKYWCSWGKCFQGTDPALAGTDL